MGLSRITASAVLPLSLQETKALARLEGEDDAVVVAYLRTATDWCENFLGRALVTSTWQYSTSCFPPYGRSIRIPVAPARSIDEVRYLDLAGDVQVLDPDVYVVSGIGDVARVNLAHGQSWPSTQSHPEAITVDLAAGYGDSWNSVPEPIRAAIAETVRGLFDGCSPSAVEEMLQYYRVRAV
jgi:uncharacterized phiE125 gp8 family phage protein